MRRAHLHIGFGALSFVCFLIATVGFDAAAKVAVAGEQWRPALSQSLYSSVTQPLASLILLAPFIAASALSAELSRTATLKVGTVFFIFLAAVLAYLYFDGYWGAQEAMRQRKWTAAALSVGMVPFLTIPVLFLAAAASGVISWRYQKRET